MQEKNATKVKDGKLIYAEESFIADVQFAIHNLLEAKGVSRADLARAMGVSEARISQLFSDNPRNLTLRTIARMFYAAGEEPQLTSKTLASLIPVVRDRDVASSKAARRHEEVAQDLLEVANKARTSFGLQANDNTNEIEYRDAA